MEERTTGSIQLKPGREKPVLNRHPWIFSGAIRRVRGKPGPGDLVDVLAHDDAWLACGYFNPHSQIRIRLLTWDNDEHIDEQWWGRRIKRALSTRTLLKLEPETNAYRLVNAEADRIPGLVVDKYGHYLVIQALTFAVDRRKEMLISLLGELLDPDGVVERSDVDVREREGLAQVVDVPWGRRPPEEYVVRENGFAFAVDLLGGQKTGLYLDQRENRALVCRTSYLQDHTVLNVFAYTGGFAPYAVAAGAQKIINVDSSSTALALAKRNVERNHGPRPDDEYVTGDAFQILREYRDDGQLFDVIILDPPKFAHRQRDVPSAARGYKDLNWLAFRLLKPGGLLATFSCSGLVSPELFQKVVFSAVSDAGRDAQILWHMSQAPDHPVLLTFPESSYLKGLFLRVY